MKKTTTKLLLAAAMLALTALACSSVLGGGDEAPSELLGEEYRSVEGGYAFYRVPDYSLEEFYGLVNMQAPDADKDSGPQLVMIGGLNEETKTLEQLLDDFSTDMEEGGEITKTENVLTHSTNSIVFN